jgi:hypothetical protein
MWPFRIVQDWESGVRIKLGNATKLLTAKNGVRGTGLHVFWPLVGDVIVEETNVEVAQTDLQTVTSADGRQVTLSLGYKYKTFNLKTTYQSIHSVEDTVANEIQATAGRIVQGLTYAEAQRTLADELLKEAGAQLAKWGIRVLDISLIEFTVARPIRLLTNMPAVGT